MPLKYQREITDEELALLHHYVVDAEQWINDAINGKIASCRKRILKSEIENAVASNKEIVTSAPEILSKFFTAENYKTRAHREHEAKSEFQGRTIETNGKSA